MGKLHQLLAVESDLELAHKHALMETESSFKGNLSLFFGAIKTLDMFDENDKTIYPEERQELTTTVEEKLDSQNEIAINYLDAVLQKEATNQTAKAAIRIDGKDLTGELPATFLLALEKKLARIKDVYTSIPVLPPGMRWEPDNEKGEGVFRAADSEKKFKTKKFFKHQVLVEPTEHHPAQIEKWEEQENVGVYTTEKWCSLISSARKTELLKRIDKLIMAVKQARQQANNVDVENITVGKLLFDYIHQI